MPLRHKHTDVVRLQVVLVLCIVMYTLKCLHAHVHMCMTVFVTPGDAVGWVMVRGTGPEHRKSRWVFARIWMAPRRRRVTPTLAYRSSG